MFVTYIVCEVAMPFLYIALGINISDNMKSIDELPSTNELLQKHPEMKLNKVFSLWDFEL